MKYRLRCAYCGSEFESKRSDALYCSDSCRTMNSRDKKSRRQSAVEYILNYNEEENCKVSDKANLADMKPEEYIKFISLNSAKDYSELLKEKKTLEEINKELKAKLLYYTDELKGGLFLDIDWSTLIDIKLAMEDFSGQHETVEEYIVYTSLNINRLIEKAIDETSERIKMKLLNK